MNDHSSLFELRISGIDSAAEMSRTWATHTVSILDPDLKEDMISKFYENRIPQPHPGLSLYRCYFHDVTLERDSGLVLATFEDIQGILEFSKDLTADDKLLVHCGAGISRSTAVATGILCQHRLPPAEAFHTVFSIRRNAVPNSYIIALMDQALKLNGDLERALQKTYFLY